MYFVHLALCGAEALVVAAKEIGLQVNADKIITLLCLEIRMWEKSRYED